jgi:hypothetical protein
MKVTSFKRFDFTAGLWTYTITRDSTGGAIYHYVFNRNIKVRATASGFGKMYVYLQLTENDVVDNCQLTDFVGPDGSEIMKGGVWQLTKVEPIFNTFGYMEGYKGQATYAGTTSPGAVVS